MKVTIVTLTFNSEKTIAETIDSVLKQKYQDIEHLFIDNVSTDKTLQIIKDRYNKTDKNYRIISEPDNGISDAFNKGIKNASGEIVVFLNSDDSYTDQDVIGDVIERFKDDRIDYVHGNMKFIDTDFGTNVRRPLLCSLEYAFPYNHPTFFVRKRVYDKVGLFNLKYKYAMDFHLICRLYQSPTQPKFISSYIEGRPLVKMKAGGVSWLHELSSIDEVKRALREFGFLTPRAEMNLFFRKLRVNFRKYLSLLGLNDLVKVWRRFKWRKH